MVNTSQSPCQLLDTPKQSVEQANLIREVEPKALTEQFAETCDASLAVQLCECISVKQLDDYTNWIQLGMTLKKVGHRWSYGNR